MSFGLWTLEMRCFFVGWGWSCRSLVPSGPACEDCVFNPKRLVQKWVDSLCELYLQPVGGGFDFGCVFLVYECR